MGASKAKIKVLLQDLEKTTTEQLSPENAIMALNTFIQLAQILFYRQKRLGKKTLKRSMVNRAWELLVDHHERCFQFKCDGASTELLGNIPEDEAVKYYGERVAGSLKDSLGQTITIGDTGLLHLYKDGNGDHTMGAEFYQPTRGKRLPWIRHVLTNSASIYIGTEPAPSGERRLVYTSRAIVPLKGKEAVNYFVVVVRRDRNSNLRFLTAYPVFEEAGFLEIIERAEPYKR